MRKLLGASLLTLISMAVSAPAQKPGPPKPAADSAQGVLPVELVVLYKNGIGYFEHSAKISGSQDLHIDFTTDQLNDVLASLTATDLGNGRITSVRFNSIAPLSQRLRALHLPLGANTTREQFLDALRGTRVEVKSGSASVTGKVLSAESVQKKVGPGQQTENVLVLSVITEAGELRSFELVPGVSVRVANHELEGDISQYLDLIGSERAADVRRMTITDEGAGERTVFISYISEVPVWKSSYRILLPTNSDEKPLIQGWAVVDNTLGEDWNNVQLSLVSGAPQSFIENLAVPYYLQRPVMPLPHSVLLTPQTHEEALESYAKASPVGVAGGVLGGTLAQLQGGTAGLGGTVTDQTGAAIPGAQVTVMSNTTGASRTTSTDSDGRYTFSNLPQGSYKVVIRSPGFQTNESTGHYLYPNRTAQADATLMVGSVTQTVEVQAAPAAPSPEFLARRFESQQPQATGKAVEELFEYDIKNRVTIARNQSALVPILQARLDAEKVTLWNASDPVALRALWLSNTTGLTFDAGTLDVLDGGTFAGEGLFKTIRAGEKRLISYAADPAVQVTTKQGSSAETVTRVVIAKGLMRATREDRSTETYRISNSDSKSRVVLIEHPVREGWKLAGNLKPDETTADYYRFKVDVKPKESAKLVVEEVHPEVSQIELTNLTSEYVALLAREKSLTAEMEAVFQKILQQKTALAALDDQIQTKQQEIANISKDQDRIRENMKALKGGAEEKQLLDRYVRELNSQEDRLAELRSQISGLKAKRDQASAQLDRTIESVNLDKTF
jgi:Carboxypeptidase regulatory-like domain